MKIKETLYTDSGQVNYQILLGEDVLLSKIEQDPSISSPFVCCLSASTNSQYTVKLLPSSGSSWPDGSIITLYGQYDNVVFKNALSTASEESYVLSLYYGIDQDAIWKMMSGSFADGWTAYSFSDNTWSDVTLGSGSAAATDTQYFRKKFVGLTGMAAYDVRLYYKAGVVAYINGAEVYRDNMPDGDVSSTTAASGEYSELAYRGFIRPGSEVATQESILAVEIHFFNP